MTQRTYQTFFHQFINRPQTTTSFWLRETGTVLSLYVYRLRSAWGCISATKRRRFAALICTPFVRSTAVYLCVRVCVRELL